MDSLERQIATRAYHLWEADGRPDDRAEEHWERARFLVGIEHSPDAAMLPNPSIPTVQNPGGTAPAGPVAEPLREAVENLGEFPGQTDQGEKAQAPIMPHEADDAADAKTAASPQRRRVAGK